VSNLLCGTTLEDRAGNFAGRSVLIAARDQLAAALALVELDGVAGRLIVCPPGLHPNNLPTVIAKGGVDAIVSDAESPAHCTLEIPTRATCRFKIQPGGGEPPGGCHTEWVLLTSGTSGAPKMIVHALESLTSAIGSRQDSGVVWGTFYDIRRYGGLQVLLRALLGQASFVLSGPEETIGDYLLRLGQHGVTHISGTPSHWRLVLMSPHARAIAPRYIRLSGEIVDQGILNALKAFYPQAAIGHVFASTEAGVGLEVTDGLEGFPASMVGAWGGREIRVDNDVLRIRSAGCASRVLGGENGWLDADGFVDTGDLVELRGGRYYFLGRRNGVINVGGLKVYPEEIEAVINRHPAVLMSRVRARRNSITGSLVVAEIVLDPDRTNQSDSVLQRCRESLAAHKVPAVVHWVPALEVTAAGKLGRTPYE
jgi:acyl-coenzyme A synthetase/AMP-(fatty) acid ligase